MSRDSSHWTARAASLHARRQQILNHFEYDLYERRDFSTPVGYPDTLRETLRVLMRGDLLSELNVGGCTSTGSGRHYWFRAEFQSLVSGLVRTLQAMLDDLVVATADDMDNPPQAWRFEGPNGFLVNQFFGPKSLSGASVACGYLVMRCSMAIRTYREYRGRIMEKLSSSSSRLHDAKFQGSRDAVSFSPRNNGLDTKAEDLCPHSAVPRQALAEDDRMRAKAGGQHAPVSSVKDVKSLGSHNSGKFSPQDSRLESQADDARAHSEAHLHALARGDRLRTNAGGQTALDLSGRDVNFLDSRIMEKLLPQHEGLDAKSGDSDPRSRAHRQDLAQGDHGRANVGGQTALVSSGKDGSSRGSRDTGKLSPQDAGPDAKSKDLDPRSHPGNPSRMRADDLYQVVARDHVQLRSDEGVACRPSADARDSTSVALPRRSREKPTSPSSSSGTPTTVRPHVGISSHGSHDTPENSPQRAEHACDNPAQFPDSECGCRALRASPDSFSPSPSSATRIHAACEPPDKATLNSSSLPTSHRLPSAGVPSAAPLLRSCRRSTSRSGPDSADWRTRGQPATLSLREAGTLNAGLRSKSIAKRDRDENPAQFPDSNGRCHPPRASAGGLSPSPSTALRRQATCEPPDKTNSNDSSLRSGQSTSRPRSATVLSAAPPFRSSYPSTSESGPDSADWRAHGWLKASSRQEVGAVEADSRDKSISKCEKDSPPGSPHRSHWEASSQAPAQDRPQVYAGGQVLASSRRDAETIATVPDDSIFTPAMVEPHLEISPGSSREIRECSPRSAKDDRGETTGLVLDSDGQVQVPQPSTENLTLSSSATPCIYATREPSDETSDRSSPDSCKPASHLRSPTVPSKFPAPLLRSSHWAAAGSGPDNANRRMRGWPEASSLRESTNLGGAQNMEWLSPRLDAADTAAPSASRLPFDAFGRGRVLEPLEDGMSGSKCVNLRGKMGISFCKNVESLNARDDEKDSPRSAGHDYAHENAAQSPDSDGRRRALRASPNSLSPSPSSPPRIHAAIEPRDKMSSSGAGPRNFPHSSHSHSASVPPVTPLLRSPRRATTGSGPDSANWRSRGLPAASSLREIDALDLGQRSTVSPRRGRNLWGVLNQQGYSHRLKVVDVTAESAFGFPFHALEYGSVSEPQDDGAADWKRVHAGGQVLASSQRDDRPESSRDAGKCLPRNARSDTVVSISDDSIRVHATVNSRVEVSPHSSQDTPERSPRSDKRFYSETRAHFLDSINKCHAPCPSTHARSSSSSTESCILAVCETPDKTSDCASPDGCRPAQQRRTASVPSSVPRHWSSRRSKDTSEPDSAAWRARGHPVAFEWKLREINAQCPAQQITGSPLKGMNPWGAQNRSGLPPRLDAADITAPSAFGLHSRAFKRGLKPPDDSASDLKPVHAGGQVALSSCKVVKPLDVGIEKKGPPQLTASNVARQRSLSARADQAMPKTGGREDLAPHCNGSGVEHGPSRSPGSPPLSTARQAEIIGQSHKSGSSAENEVSLISGRSNDLPRKRSTNACDEQSYSPRLDDADTARDCGLCTHALDPVDGEAFALLSTCGPPDGQLSVNVEVLRIEALLREPSSSNTDAPDVSATGCTSRSDMTPRPGESFSPVIEDGECSVGHAMRSYDDPGGPTRIAPSGDANLSGICEAQAVSPPYTCLYSRKSAAHTERPKEAPGRPESGAQPVGDTYASSGRKLAQRSHQDAYNACGKGQGFFGEGKAGRDLARCGEYVLRKQRNNSALPNVRVLPLSASCARLFPRALAPLIKHPFPGAGETIRVSEASMDQRCRQLFMPESTYLLSPWRKMRVPIHAEMGTGGPAEGCLRDSDIIRRQEELPPCIAHALLSISCASRTTRDNSPQNFVPAPLAAELLADPQEVRSQPDLLFIGANQRCWTAGQALVHKIQQTPLHEQATTDSTGVDAGSIGPSYESTPTIGRLLKFQVPEDWLPLDDLHGLPARSQSWGAGESRMLSENRRVSHTSGTAPGRTRLAVPEQTSATRSRYLVPATPMPTASRLPHRSSQRRIPCARPLPTPSARPIHRLRSHTCCLYSARLGSLPSAFTFNAPSSASFPARSRMIVNGVYIRSTPPVSRVCTANGGAQGEVLPSACEEGTTSIWATARWLAGRSHSLDRGAPCLEEFETALADVTCWPKGRQPKSNEGCRRIAKQWQRTPTRFRTSAARTGSVLLCVVPDELRALHMSTDPSSGQQDIVTHNDKKTFLGLAKQHS